MHCLYLIVCVYFDAYATSLSKAVLDSRFRYFGFLLREMLVLIVYTSICKLQQYCNDTNEL